MRVRVCMSEPEKVAPTVPVLLTDTVVISITASVLTDTIVFPA